VIDFGKMLPERMAAIGVGGVGLVRASLPFPGCCQLSASCLEHGACAAFSRVFPRRLLPRVANRSWMNIACEKRKDVGRNHLPASFPRLPVWWRIFLSP